MLGSTKARLLATPEVLFNDFVVRCGSDEGARATFQVLISDLVASKHEGVREVAGPGGSDWGIDTYVGEFSDTVTVWQSKFFKRWDEKTKGNPEPPQRGQVRESFNEIVSKAKEHDFTLDSWTLCIPCQLPPIEQKWFDGWKSAKQREHKIDMDILNGPALRRWLLKPDAERVAELYFGSDVLGAAELVAAPPSGIAALSEALFVKQLRAAGHVQTDAARGLYFAAEALFRNMQDRGDTLRLAALEEAHLELHAVWEQHFNDAHPTADAEGRMPGLVRDVLASAAATSDPPPLNLRPAHRKGMVHRLVEASRAGWVSHWQELAADYAPIETALAELFPAAPATEGPS
jgi:hypothetical protein